MRMRVSAAAPVVLPIRINNKVSPINFLMFPSADSRNLGTYTTLRVERTVTGVITHTLLATLLKVNVRMSNHATSCYGDRKMHISTIT